MDRPRDLKIYQRRLEVDHAMQQCQVEEQLLELARNHHELQDMRDEVDSRDVRIERLQRDLERYQMQRKETAKEDNINTAEDEGSMSDLTYSFEQDCEVGVASEVGGASERGRKSLKTSGSSSSVDYSGTVAKTTTTPMSPKRKISGSIKRIIKRSALTSSSDSVSKTGDSRKRWSSNSDKENFSPMAVPDSPTRLAGVTRQPLRGEKRYVYLNTKSGKYGFKLQSYGRVSEQGKVLQTFVQSVAPGTPAFFAGLYPGDAIVEVNGLDVKYSPMDITVDAIKKEATKGDRVLLKVVFSDGVTRVNCMKKMDDLKVALKKKQGRLKELIQMEEKYLPPVSVVRLSSPIHTVAALDIPMWEESPPTFEPIRHTFGYNRQLNQLVGIHRDNITALECDALVMPCSSNHNNKDGNKNLLLQLLKTGGCRMMDQISLSRHCKIGSNILTQGHGIRARYIYHCVFGDLEESLQSCCYKALESARAEKVASVVFWLDGFAFLSVSPQMVIEAVRCWLQQDLSKNTFQKVLFSSKANADLVEAIMKKTFPLFPSVSSNRGSYASSMDDSASTDLGKRDSVFSEEDVRSQGPEDSSAPPDTPCS